MSDESPAFIAIDELEQVGVSVADINKLKSSGIATVMACLQTTRKSLEKIKGMSEAKVSKIKEAAQKLSPSSFKTGTEISVAREKVVYISTGSKALDAVLGGGISTQSITEVYGEFRTGKTQLCHTLAVTCQLPLADGGGEGKVAIIDTEGTFRPDRIRAIAQRFGVDSDAALDNIVVGRAHNSEHQSELLALLAAKFAEEGTYRLLIIDSIMALYRTDYSGRGELATRQQNLGQMLSRLTKMAEEFNIAVFYSNHVQSDPGASSMFAGASDKKPIGGHVLAHASTTRIALRKGRGDERIAKLADSPEQAEAEATYKLSAGGVEDV